MSLYEVIGRNEPDYLLYDPNGAERIAVPMEPGAGTVNRGTVCYRKESGMYAAAAAAQAVGTNYLVVLDETVDTGDGDTAVAATAFRSGKLVKGKVKITSFCAAARVWYCASRALCWPPWPVKATPETNEKVKEEKRYAF